MLPVHLKVQLDSLDLTEGLNPSIIGKTLFLNTDLRHLNQNTSPNKEFLLLQGLPRTNYVIAIHQTTLTASLVALEIKNEMIVTPTGKG